MIELEKFKGTRTRHICPSCGARNAFARYVGDDGRYLHETVGRCNRESKCGYHYKPKQFFADNPQAGTKVFKKAKKRSVTNYGFADKSNAQNNSANLQNKPDFIPFEQFQKTLGNYDQNNFVKFLLNLFSECREEITDVLKMYFVGTFEDYRGNYTCFPSIDRQMRIARAKLIRFNPETGKRLKGDYDTSSLPAKLKLKDFNYKQIFFGEHLLPQFPDKPVAIVEAEKTAIIASLCMPEFVWLGCNSKTWLKPERLRSLGRRKIILYPDADGFELWQKIALEAGMQGIDVRVSTIIENHATDEQRAAGYDLADYLIKQSQDINAYNESVDSYNAHLEMVLGSDLKWKVEEWLDEQKAVAMIDGGLPENQAENLITDFANIRRIIEAV